MSNLPDLEYIEVANTTNFGFWELNYIQRRGYLRERSHIIPLDQRITDKSKDFDTIDQYLATKLKGWYVKMLIPDRKVVWSPEPYCEWESHTADRDDPNTILYCQHPALVEKRGKLLCGEHAHFKL